MQSQSYRKALSIHFFSVWKLLELLNANRHHTDSRNLLVFNIFHNYMESQSVFKENCSNPWLYRFLKLVRFTMSNVHMYFVSTVWVIICLLLNISSILTVTHMFILSDFNFFFYCRCFSFFFLVSVYFYFVTSSLQLFQHFSLVS